MSEKPVLVIKDGCVVTGDAKDTRFERADVAIRGRARRDARPQDRDLRRGQDARACAPPPSASAASACPRCAKAPRRLAANQKQVA